MPIIHAQSPCCQEIIYRFGSRRRQCRACGRTWRIRRKKTGRKPKRSSYRLPQKFMGYGRITAWAHTRHVSTSTASERLAGALRRFLKKKRILPHGSYALLGDGLYFKFKRMDWVMYVMAIKPVKSHKAYFLDPVLLEGKESYERWRQAIATMPPQMHKRIKAFVSDGFRGSNENSPLKCNFPYNEVAWSKQPKSSPLSPQSGRPIEVFG